MLEKFKKEGKLSDILKLSKFNLTFDFGIQTHSVQWFYIVCFSQACFFNVYEGMTNSMQQSPNLLNGPPQHTHTP